MRHRVGTLYMFARRMNEWNPPMMRLILWCIWNKLGCSTSPETEAAEVTFLTRGMWQQESPGPWGEDFPESEPKNIERNLEMTGLVKASCVTFQEDWLGGWEHSVSGVRTRPCFELESEWLRKVVWIEFPASGTNISWSGFRYPFP